MTSEKIFEGISYIDGALAERSAAVLKKRRFVGFAKIAASAAAALALVFGGYAAVYNAAVNNLTSDNEVPPVVIAEIDGAGYCMEGFHTGDIREVRKAHGLPEPTGELKGGFIVSRYVDFGGGTSGYVDFYGIKGSINREIILGEFEGKLSYWLMVYGGESFETANERLKYFGYDTVEDVHIMRVNGKNVKDADKISEVWNALLNGTRITAEEYERLLQGEDYDEANAQEVYSRHEDSHIMLEFNYGEPNYLCFGYYTDIGCFDGVGYILSPEPIAF